MSELARQQQHYSAVKQRLFGKPEVVNVATPAIQAKRQDDAAKAATKRALVSFSLKAQVKATFSPQAYPANAVEFNRDPMMDPGRYIKVRARELGFTHEDIIGQSRDYRITGARHLIMWEVRTKFRSMSYSKIGRLFGDRDHSSVLNAIHKMQKKVSQA